MPPKKLKETKTTTCKVSTATATMATAEDGRTETVTVEETATSTVTVSRTVTGAGAIDSVAVARPWRLTGYNLFVKQRLAESGVSVLTPQRFTIIFN
jgi:hypothetical protein